MKKVGILSMQRIKNYGSFLQAYALKNMIEDLGYSVEFVDYRVGEPLINDANNHKFSKLATILKGDAPLIQKLQYIIHKINFDKKYLSQLDLTKYPNYTPKLDVLVIGSDEVFNCIQKNKNVGYSLELFGKDNNAKKVITYAASFGNTTVEKIKEYKKDSELANLVKKIDRISVRDKNSYDIIKKISGRKVETHLDPVLIYDYMNDCKLIPELSIKEKYMIVYAYSGRISKYENQYIKKYAKEKKLKVYAIGGAQNCADKFIDCSPFEALAFFKNAECIITDTFHGSIFSIINRKPFVTIVRKSFGNSYGNEEKLTDLLKKLDLLSRFTYEINDIEKIMEDKINYYNTFSIIEKERDLALEYLQKEIKKCIQN